MTALSPFSPVSEDKNISLLSSKKNSVSDVGETTEAQAQGMVDVPVTSVASADDSRGLPTPDCDSIEVKLTSASRWATVQEALETCLDPFFLAGQSSVKDEKIVEELTQLLDTSLTAHVPAVAGLAFLQPLFSGVTRSERLDAVLRAARLSNKLMLRDDLPVPSSIGWMLAVDEAEAAGLRVGPRSHAEGVNRSVLTLERRPSSVDGDDALRAFTLPQLQATVPPHKIIKMQRSESPCVVKAVFVSPAAAERAYAVWRTHAPHSDVRVTRVGGSGGGVGCVKPLPIPPLPASEQARIAAASAAAAVPAPRTALRCPRVVGEALSRPSSCEHLTSKVAATSPAPAAQRAAVPVPKPPPAIDAVVAAGGQPVASVAASSGPSTTSTTPSPESSTSKSKFNMNAAPFLPKSVLDAQIAAAAAVGAESVSPAAAGWWTRGGRSRRPVGCDEVSGSSVDASEALANQMLMDPSTGWMYPGLDAYSGSAWKSRFTAVDNWAEGGAANLSGVCRDISTLSSPSPMRREPPAMPERPKAVDADMPVAPCAVGDSPRSKVPQSLGAAKTRTDLYPPRPVSMSLPPEPAGGYGGGGGGARTSPLSQTSPATLSTSRRHRHDPYSPSGFVLCAESSCASSLTHPHGTSITSPGGATASSSTRLLVAGSLTSERMAASFCFEDPLIHASARRRERRRLQRTADHPEGEEEGAAHTPSSELESTSSKSEEPHAAPAVSGTTDTSDVVEQRGEEETAVSRAEDVEAAETNTTTTTTAAAEDTAVAPVSAPKSYAEALRLKAKAPPVVAIVSAKSAEATGERAGKAGAATAKKTRQTAAVDRKSATTAVAKPLIKAKKMAAAA